MHGTEVRGLLDKDHKICDRTVIQWIALLPHNKKVPASNLSRNFSECRKLIEIPHERFHTTALNTHFEVCTSF